MGSVLLDRGRWVLSQNNRDYPPDHEYHIPRQEDISLLTVERLRSTALSEGRLYARMCTRFPDDHMWDEFDYAFDQGLRWMLNHPQAPYLCLDCGIAIGPEWWLCPLCERRWLDSEGLPNWPAWNCDFCDAWGPHEIQICYWCCSPRDPDPRITDPFARERAARDSAEPMDFFDDEYEDPSVGERLVPDPPLLRTWLGSAAR